MPTNPSPAFDAPLVLLIAGAVGLLLFLLVVVLLLLRRRRRPAGPPPVDLRIDVRRLPLGPPPAEGPRLEFFGVPVRLAALVLAPAGRNSQLPDEAQLAAVVEDLAPGLWSVVQQHGPAIYRWPPQLSTQGFTHLFFNNAQLPGERGKGSVWCAAAGRFDAGEHQLLAGVICVSEKPNSLSQVAVTQIGQWLEVLRVKG